MPLGIQRWVSGIDMSSVVPPMSSARLQHAIACTVPRWLWTPHQSGMRASPRPGSSETIIAGVLVLKLSH